jgi:hypothetical protein
VGRVRATFRERSDGVASAKDKNDNLIRSCGGPAVIGCRPCVSAAAEVSAPLRENILRGSPLEAEIQSRTCA